MITRNTVLSRAFSSDIIHTPITVLVRSVFAVPLPSSDVSRPVTPLLSVESADIVSYFLVINLRMV